MHEFLIGPFGFYELEMFFATSRASECHGGSLGGIAMQSGMQGKPCEGRVDKHMLCLIRSQTDSSIADVASVMSR